MIWMVFGLDKLSWKVFGELILVRVAPVCNIILHMTLDIDLFKQDSSSKMRTYIHMRLKKSEVFFRIINF